MQLRTVLRLVVLGLIVFMLSVGCSKIKDWAGYGANDETDAEMVPPESQQETVIIDGKPYVRSKNPYWMSVVDSPEYLYVEKGEHIGVKQHFVNSLARIVGLQQQKTGGAGTTDKSQEMVRSEVDHLRAQGLGGFVSQTKGSGGSETVAGRAVAVIPDLDTPNNLNGLNRTLSMTLGGALGQTENLRVSTPVQIDGALRKAGVGDKKTISSKIQALGGVLGVQGIVLTGLVPPQGESQGVLVMQIYDTFNGLQQNSLVVPVPVSGLTPENMTKFAQNNALRVSGDLVKIAWFGWVEFVKEGKIYLNLGQNPGLKVGDRLKVVEPGKEIVNPTTHKVLGYTADVPQGEIKVTELLGNTGAVAQPLSGGPFSANDKVKVTK